MDILDYLKFVKDKFVNNLSSYVDIHIVIGNESCDLDSTVSSLTLAYFLYKSRVSQIPSSALIIPVLNVSRENFLLRTENCFVLHELGIPLECLIYRDDINIKELIKSKQVTSSLVDHHILSNNDYILQPTVIQIFDHRPLDTSYNWTNKDIKLKIEEVGSCSTLIANEILHTDDTLLNRDLAYAIYRTIVYDTVALRPENGRAKELDVIIAKKLEDKFSINEGRHIIYDKLWAIHNDISHLSPKQVLLKDLKIVETIPVPGLPLLVQDFLKLKHAYEAIESMAFEYKVPLLILVGLDATNKVKRDVGLYWRDDGKSLKDMLLMKLKNSEALKQYNFCYEEVCSGYKNITCLIQNNIKLSRKQIIPLIKDAVLEHEKIKIK